ncbi:MAG: hypothetical protein HQL38_14005 [Alphaproteobacteria bacterium]|nr:hypothetical protein [Alphaproteobacteria bacterium]
MRNLFRLAAMAALLGVAPTVMAQGNAPIDKAYESSKSAELESLKLQLATRQDSRGIGEVTEADSALRRLRETEAPDLRRRIATELELALTRLRLEADSASLGK